jgi:hypothetical protein
LENNNLNKYADLDDLDSISDIINIGRRTQKVGDANGYKHTRMPMSGKTIKKLKNYANKTYLVNHGIRFGKYLMKRRTKNAQRHQLSCHDRQLSSR